MNQQADTKANDDFILYWPEYDALLNKIQGYLDQANSGPSADYDWSGFLAAYGQLLEMRDHGFPLLLREGEAFRFDIRPASIHLLPPMDDRPAERWLLATLVQEEEPKSWVQILTWRVDKQGAYLQALANQPPQPIAACRFRLDFRPSAIEFLCQAGFGAIRLVFPLGELQLMVNANVGIVNNAWQDKTVPSGVHIERYSWGRMETAIQVKRYPTSREKFWQDNILTDTGGRHLLPTDDGNRLGRIFGADGPSQHANLVYLASNRGRVYRIDKNQPQQKPLESFQRTDEVLDVLVVPWPPGSKDDHAALATERNGSLYLLQEKEGKLKALHWHYTRSHIWRVIGYGDGHLLSLDERSKLTPLRLVDPRGFAELRANATRLLALHYLHRSSGAVSWKRAQSLKWLRRDPELFMYLGRLALEFFLSHCNDSSNQEQVRQFLQWSRWLNDVYNREGAVNYTELSRLHIKLIKHLTRWMAKCYFQHSPPPQLGPAIEAIWNLLTPNPKAPDIVWIPLLRKYDWVRFWAEKNGLMNQAEFREHYWHWENSIQQRRLEFLPGLSKIRTLNTVSSQRFAGPSNHIEIIDSVAGYIAVLDSTFGLRILQVPETGEAWKQQDILPHLDKNGKFRWQSPPNFVRVLPSTGSLQGVRLLMGTSRGELFLLQWNKSDGFKLLHQKNDCGFSLACCEYLPNRAWVLLGGRNNKGRACLYGFPARQDKPEPKLHWQDEEGDLYGTIHRLNVSQKGDKLWAINRDRARLYTWNLGSEAFREGFTFKKPQNWLDNMHKLFALDYSKRHNLLVCGGDGGMVWAVEADSGATRWVVNVSGNLRQVACLADYPEKPAWLLCGDDHSSLLVDKNGNVLGVIEKAGPVSALAVFGQRLFLGIQNGRVVQFGINQAEDSLDNINKNYAAYPIRHGYQDDWPREGLLKALHETSLAGESLPAMRVLQAFAAYLGKNGIDEKLATEFEGFFHSPQQTLERRIIFLYKLRDVCRQQSIHPEAMDFVLGLLENCFRHKTQTNELISESGLLCKVISPIFDILDGLGNAKENVCNRALSLRKSINAWVWYSGSNPAIPAIRINQALKLWRNIDKEGKAIKPSQRLFDWCNALSVESDAHEVKALLANLSALFGSGLILFAWNDPWHHWIYFLTRGGDKLIPTPEPLCLLETPQSQPLQESVLDALTDAFPENGAWKNWLINLQSALGAVQNTAASIHEAWRERSALRGLREHIGRGQREIFTVEEQQALLGLWWPTLEQAWFRFADLRMQELEQRVAANPKDYLSLTHTDRWRSRDRVELTLALANHFPGPLSIEKVQWNNSPMPLAGLPLQLSPGPQKSLLVINLNNEGKDRINGDLRLLCVDMESGRVIPLDYPAIEISRNLERFFDVPPWCGTGNRLTELLTDYIEEKKTFLWVDGNQWTKEERQNLKDEVMRKLTLAFIPLKSKKGLERLLAPCLKSDKHLSGHPHEIAQDEPDKLAWNLELPLFSPDLALDANPTEWLEQIHALLTSLAGDDRPYLALAVWFWANNIPADVQEALKTLTPTRTEIESLMLRLLADPDKVQRLQQALAGLPARALGAWCVEEPFYAPQPGERYRPEELYLPPACLLKQQLFNILDEAEVSLHDMQEFLSLGSEEIAGQQRESRAIFRQSGFELFTHSTRFDPSRHDDLAQRLLLKLGDGIVEFRDGAWHLDIPLTLNWQDYKRIYLLPKSNPTERSVLQDKPFGLWLCLGEAAPPPDLPGLSLAISEPDAWALLHTERSVEAIMLLNRVAAPQYRINPRLCFRDLPGLGPELVAKHFAGREDNLMTLWDCLHNADKGSSGSALLIGRRRMGKSSLRERIQWEVAKNEPQRVILYFNFEDVPVDRKIIETPSPTIQSYKLERWFFGKMRETLAKQKIGVDYAWRKEFETNAGERQKAREQIKRYLAKIKIDTGHALLLAFDETDNLVRVDKEKSLFAFLRALADQGLLCLMVTSYPYGEDEQDALNVIIDDARAGNPLHNMFTKIELGAWPPETAWNYIHSRLSGLGVVLPHFYRDKILKISRGIPWIIHAFGLAICKAFDEQNKPLRLVDVQVWRHAQNAVLADIHRALHASIRRSAEIVDQNQSINLNINPEQGLSGGNLWQVLCALAQSKDTQDQHPIQAWPEPISFDIAELQARLPGVKHTALREVLKLLAASPALEGMQTDRSRYVFANHLLPMWLRYGREDFK